MAAACMGAEKGGDEEDASPVVQMFGEDIPPEIFQLFYFSNTFEKFLHIFKIKWPKL